MKRLFFALVVSSLVGWLTGPAAAQLFPIRAGGQPITAQLPLYVALDGGYFREEGLDVKFDPIGLPPRIVEAISGGSLDVGVATATTVSMLKDQGFDFAIFAGSTNQGRGPTRDGSPLVVLEESPIRTAKELEGKKVAVGGLKIVNWLYMAEWLARNGADPKKVNWVEIPFAQMGPSLLNKLVDAANITEPFITIAEAQKPLRIISSPMTDVSPEVILGTWAARLPWLKANHSRAEAFARAIGRAIDYISANPDQRVPIMLKHIKMEPEVAKKQVWFRWEKKVSLKALQEQADLAFKWGLIKKRQDAREFLYETATR